MTIWQWKNLFYVRLCIRSAEQERTLELIRFRISFSCWSLRLEPVPQLRSTSQNVNLTKDHLKGHQEHRFILNGTHTILQGILSPSYDIFGPRGRPCPQIPFCIFCRLGLRANSVENWISLISDQDNYSSSSGGRGRRRCRQRRRNGLSQSHSFHSSFSVQAKAERATIEHERLEWEILVHKRSLFGTSYELQKREGEWQVCNRLASNGQGRTEGQRDRRGLFMNMDGRRKFPHCRLSGTKWNEHETRE